jgi:hypothetical protein
VAVCERHVQEGGRVRLGETRAWKVSGCALPENVGEGLTRPGCQRVGGWQSGDGNLERRRGDVAVGVRRDAAVLPYAYEVAPLNTGEITLAGRLAEPLHRSQANLSLQADGGTATGPARPRAILADQSPPRRGEPGEPDGGGMRVRRRL